MTVHDFVVTNITMKIEFDQAKRDKTLSERGLDFADAAKVFSGYCFNAIDVRFDNGEERVISVGVLALRVVVVVWTPRKNVRRIISMRYANEREASKYKQQLG